jgi:uncharacterized protein (UPF0248 family)
MNVYSKRQMTHILTKYNEKDSFYVAVIVVRFSLANTHKIWTESIEQFCS